MEHLRDGDEPAFGIEALDHLQVVLTTNQGFQYSVNPSRISVTFASRAKIKHRTAMETTIENLSEVKPFSELLPLVCEKLIEAAMLLPSAEKRRFSRIGIVSRTLAQETEFPPGIKKLIEHLGKPWAGGLDAYNVSLTAQLGSSSKWAERCIHQLAKSDAGGGNVPILNLDWQRAFKAEQHLNREALVREMNAARSAAVHYMEELAEGNMFDEDLTG
ncbi:hypothetical protein [Methylocystis echinoides]|uniref:hypothetical protein n=1 Tax=Methylocystis echinoides TaxID=29468 RepID=UPI00341F3A11